MNLQLEARLGLRYTLGHRRSRLGNFITLVSSLGLILGVSMLIIVLAVMNGFDKEMRERILVAVPHIKLTQSEPAARAHWQVDSKTVASHPEVTAVSPYTELDVLFRHKGKVEPGLLNALDPELAIEQGMLASIFSEELLRKLMSQHGLIIGAGLAEHLAVEEGDRIVPLVYESRSRRLQSASFEVIGIFHSGTELDQALALTSLESIASIPSQSSLPMGLRVQTESIFDVRYLARELQSALPLGYRTSTWQETQGNLYEAIQMSRYLVFLIVVLILAIAAFNLIATLLIASADKQSEIAILKTLGAEPASLSRVFAFQGLFVGVLGSLAGAVFGVLVAQNMTRVTLWAEQAFGFKLLNSQVYPLDYLPSWLDWNQTLAVVIVAILLSVLASLYPAWKVAQVEAAQVLRYE